MKFCLTPRVADLGTARDPEEVETMEDDSAPPQSAEAVPRLYKPKWVSPHPSLHAALLSSGPRTPCGHCRHVTQAQMQKHYQTTELLKIMRLFKTIFCTFALSYIF